MEHAQPPKTHSQDQLLFPGRAAGRSEDGAVDAGHAELHPGCGAFGESLGPRRPEELEETRNLRRTHGSCGTPSSTLVGRGKTSIHPTNRSHHKATTKTLSQGLSLPVIHTFGSKSLRSKNKQKTLCPTVDVSKSTLLQQIQVLKRHQ